MREFMVDDCAWLTDLAEGEGERFRAGVKVRSTMREEPASVERVGDHGARVIYDEPQWAPAPGQSAVFYEGDTVIGGGIITDVLNNEQ